MKVWGTSGGLGNNNPVPKCFLFALFVEISLQNKLFWISPGFFFSFAELIIANWVADLKQFYYKKNEKDSFQVIKTRYSMDAKLRDKLKILGQGATGILQIRHNFQAIGRHWMISD